MKRNKFPYTLSFFATCIEKLGYKLVTVTWPTFRRMLFVLSKQRNVVYQVFLLSRRSLFIEWILLFLQLLSTNIFGHVDWSHVGTQHNIKCYNCVPAKKLFRLRIQFNVCEVNKHQVFFLLCFCRNNWVT
jgi:hypothetical protein